MKKSGNAHTEKTAIEFASISGVLGARAWYRRRAVFASHQPPVPKQIAKKIVPGLSREFPLC
jgi:hypothetical protein